MAMFFFSDSTFSPCFELVPSRASRMRLGDQAIRRNGIESYEESPCRTFHGDQTMGFCLARPLALALSLLLFFPFEVGAKVQLASEVDRSIEQENEKGELVFELENRPNYPDGQYPYPEESGGFRKASLLRDGTFVVVPSENEPYRRPKRIQLSRRNIAEMERLASELYRVPLEEIRREAHYLKPLTRGVLSVARYDWKTKSWSQDLRTVWMESGCEYDFLLGPKDLYDQMLVHILIARLESIAYEINSPRHMMTLTQKSHILPWPQQRSPYETSSLYSSFFLTPQRDCL